MPRKRATLRGVWWKKYFGSIQNCYQCGQKLARRYVKQEKKRRHICESCGNITYVNPRVVAGLVPVTSDGKVVLLKRDNEPALGRWTFPAGFQEMGESVREAAARETKEEIGARVKVGRLIGIYSYADAGVVTIVYEGRLLRGEKPQAGQEAQEVSVVKWSEIPWKHLAFRSTSHALHDWKKGKVRS
jgi:ADP-ribose pyrophosphatase YjhB (NUDIX family)